MPGIGLLSIGTREKDSRKADVLGRWICCLWGGDVPAGMPVSISERANGAFGFPSLASYKNYRCYLQMHPASRKEENTNSSSPRAVSR